MRKLCVCVRARECVFLCVSLSQLLSCLCCLFSVCWKGAHGAISDRARFNAIQNIHQIAPYSPHTKKKPCAPHEAWCCVALLTPSHHTGLNPPIIPIQKESTKMTPCIPIKTGTHKGHRRHRHPCCTACDAKSTSQPMRLSTLKTLSTISSARNRGGLMRFDGHASRQPSRRLTSGAGQVRLVELGAPPCEDQHAASVTLPSTRTL